MATISWTGTLNRVTVGVDSEYLGSVNDSGSFAGTHTLSGVEFPASWMAGDSSAFARSVGLSHLGTTATVNAFFHTSDAGAGGGPGPDLSNALEMGLIMEFSYGAHSVRVPWSEADTSDTTEPYTVRYATTNSVYTDIGNFIDQVPDGLQTITVTFDDGLFEPVFSDDTGTDFTGTVGTAISEIQVPAASGNPAPTYASVGALPAGIDFDASTRTISGTPQAVGSGTITIRATNSQGSDDWTVDYSFVSATEAPAFADDTGDAVSGVARVAINSIAIPRASGTPAPSYAQVGSGPAGLTVTLPTSSADGSITGSPEASGSGTITVRATNSEGTDDWTVNYSFADPVAGDLDFAAFEATGTIHMYMRIVVGMYTRGNGQVNLWGSNEWTADGSAGQVGSVADGSQDIRGIFGNAPRLRRFAKWDRSGSDDRFIFNSVGSGDVGGLFNSSGDPYRVSYVVEGPALHTLVTPSTGAGTSFVDWRRTASNFTNDMWDALNAIADGDEVILVVHQGTATYTPPTETFDVGLAFSASASGAMALAIAHVEATEVLDVGLAFSASGDGAFALAVEHTEAGEVLEVGLAFSGSAASQFALSVSLVEAGETLDVGLAFAASAATSFSLGLFIVPRGETFDVGLGFSGSAAGAFALAIEHAEASEVLDIGLASSASASGSFTLSISLVEASETHNVGLRFSGSASGQFRLGITLAEQSEVLQIGLAFDGSVSGAWELGIEVSASQILQGALASSRSLVGHTDKYALEIDHISLSTPIRLVNDGVDYLIESNVFTKFAFSAEPPQDIEQEVRRGLIRLDNVGRDLMSLIEGSRGAFGATMRIMQVVPDLSVGIVSGRISAAVTWSVTMSVGIAEITNESVAFTLVDEPIVGRASVTMRHDPSTSPGLF